MAQEFKIHINGVLVSTNTADGVLELITKMGAIAPAPTTNAARTMPRTAPTAALAPPPESTESNADVERTVAMLNAIRKNNGRIESVELQKLVGADHPRGIGAKLRPVKRVIEGLGYKLEDVFTSERTADGSLWESSGKMLEVLDKLTD